MADGVMSTGVVELERQIESFSDAERAALQQVAEDTAERVATRARQRVHVRSGYTHDQIEVHHDPARRQSQVTVGPTMSHPATREHPANVAIFLEFGTRYMSASPFMRPALDAEEVRYHDDLARVSLAIAEKHFR